MKRMVPSKYVFVLLTFVTVGMAVGNIQMHWRSSACLSCINKF